MEEGPSDRSWRVTFLLLCTLEPSQQVFFLSSQTLEHGRGWIRSHCHPAVGGEDGNPSGTWFSFLIMTVCQVRSLGSHTSLQVDWFPSKQEAGKQSSRQTPGSSHDSHMTCLQLHCYCAREDVLRENAPSLQPKDPTVISFYVTSCPCWSHVYIFLGPTVANFLKDKVCVF